MNLNFVLINVRRSKELDYIYSSIPKNSFPNRPFANIDDPLGQEKPLKVVASSAKAENLPRPVKSPLTHALSLVTKKKKHPHPRDKKTLAGAKFPRFPGIQGQTPRNRGRKNLTVSPGHHRRRENSARGERRFSGEAGGGGRGLPALTDDFFKFVIFLGVGPSLDDRAGIAARRRHFAGGVLRMRDSQAVAGAKSDRGPTRSGLAARLVFFVVVVVTGWRHDGRGSAGAAGFVAPRVAGAEGVLPEHPGQAGGGEDVGGDFPGNGK